MTYFGDVSVKQRDFIVDITNLTKPWTCSCMMTTLYSFHCVPVSETLLSMSDNRSLHTFTYMAPCRQSLYRTSNVISRSMRIKFSEKFVLTPASSTKYTSGLFIALKWMPVDLIFANLKNVDEIIIRWTVCDSLWLGY